MQIHLEQQSDWDSVFALHADSFPTQAEAQLVERLRERASPLISLVARQQDALVGHILFSPITIANDPRLFMGLAPMAVARHHQRQGIGSALIETGIRHCQRQEVVAIFVLGHADYYPRFGFKPTAPCGIVSEYDVPAENFMVLPLDGTGFSATSGVARYHEEFARL